MSQMSQAGHHTFPDRVRLHVAEARSHIMLQAIDTASTCDPCMACKESLRLWLLCAASADRAAALKNDAVPAPQCQRSELAQETFGSVRLAKRCSRHETETSEFGRGRTETTLSTCASVVWTKRWSV